MAAQPSQQVRSQREQVEVARRRRVDQGERLLRQALALHQLSEFDPDGARLGPQGKRATGEIGCRLHIAPGNFDAGQFDDSIEIRRRLRQPLPEEEFRLALVSAAEFAGGLVHNVWKSQRKSILTEP